MDNIEDNARKLAGTVDLEAGEGRTNVPVGTIMAMIEQQTQMMTAVHKGLHQAQQEEMILLRELFIEDPEPLWRDNPHATRRWKAEELTDLSFVPASDPNVPAHIHRTMQGYALAMLSQNNPLYNQMAVQKRLLDTLRIPDSDELLVQRDASQASSAGATQPGALPPAALAALAQGELQTKTQKNILDYQSRLADIRQRATKDMLTLQADLSESAKDRESREVIAAMQEQTKLILKGIEQLGQPTSPDPLRDQAAGP
jgi:hypothetical protein